MENSPLILEEIEVYLYGTKLCFINQNTCEEGVIILGTVSRGGEEYLKYVSHIEPECEMEAEREELYEAFFESNWDLLTSAKQI